MSSDRSDRHRNQDTTQTLGRIPLRGLALVLSALLILGMQLVHIQKTPAQSLSTPSPTPELELAQLPQALLKRWVYDPRQSRLEIETEGSVRPSLFILQNPPRIVVDFPNTRWPKPGHQESYSQGRIRSLTVEEPMSGLTRLILGVNPDQPLDLSQLQLQTANPELWAVQFAGASALLPASPLIPPSAVGPPLDSSDLSPAALSPSSGQPSNSAFQLISVSGTAEGFFVKTQGSPQVAIRRISDPDRVLVDFLDTTVSPSLSQRAFSVNRLGVSQLRVGQFQPTVSRVVLDVDPSSSDWETSYDAQMGGVNLYPAGGSSQASLIPEAPSSVKGVAVLQSVRVQGDVLSIQANGNLYYRSGWDPASGGYRIRIKPAQLPSVLPDPGLAPNSPVERIRFVQEDPQTVSILVQPSSGFSATEAHSGQGTSQITLRLQSTPGVAVNPVAPAAPTGIPPILANPTVPGQIRVAIDPGHGGRDPGAVGVNGIQEKDVVINISLLVAQMLQDRGIIPVLTRTDDREVLLQPRVDTAIVASADILVSIHANAVDRSGVRGIETYYLRPDSARLATVLHRYLVGGSGALDRGIRRARFYMVRATPETIPSVLLEVGYVTDDQEGGQLGNPAYQRQLASAIVDGILAYFQRP